MSKGRKTMTELLKQALSEADSLRAVARATDTEHPSVVRFLQGKQSLRLDIADRLSAYFGIASERRRRTADELRSSRHTKSHVESGDSVSGENL